MAISALVLDFDGVIIDSESGKQNAWFDVLKTDADPAGFSWTTFDSEKLIQAAHAAWIEGTARGSRYDIIEHMMDAVGYPKTKKLIQWYADRYAEIVRVSVFSKEVSDDARKALDELSKKVPLYLNSATPEKELKTVMMELGLEKYFKGILGKAPERYENSKVQNLELVSQKENIPVEDILFVGDAESDYLAARTAKTQFVRFKSFSNEKTWNPEAPRSITRLSELLHFLA